MYIRLSVVKMVKQGSTRGEAAEFFNVHRKTAENWVALSEKSHVVSLFAPEKIYDLTLHMTATFARNEDITGADIESLISAMRDDLDNCKKMDFK